MKLIILHDENGDIEVFPYIRKEKDAEAVEMYMDEVLDISSNDVTWVLVDEINITIH